MTPSLFPGFFAMNNISRHWNAIWQHILAGRFSTFSVFVIFGILVLIFLNLTIYNRDPQHVIDRLAIGIHTSATKIWVEDGYFKHAGLLFFPADPKRDWHPGAYHYKSYTGGFLLSLFAVQKAHYLVRGHYSYMLTGWHNRLFMLFTSALLGFLALRLSRRIYTDAPMHTLLLGLGVTLVFQTFPSNALVFWDIWAAVFCLPFIFGLFLIEEATFQRPIPKRLQLLHMFLLFAIVYIDRITGFMIIFAFFLANLIFLPANLQRYHLLKNIVLPIGLATCIHQGQLLLAKVLWPSLDLIGSGMLFRMGLDGSTGYFTDHFALLTGRHLSTYYYNGTLEFINWKYLFLISLAAYAILLLSRYVKKNNICEKVTCPFVFALAALSAYIFYGFTLVNAVVLHADLLDCLVVYPCVLTLFAIVPSLLEEYTGKRGLAVYLAVVGAICYAFVSLRTYAIAFPLGL